MGGSNRSLVDLTHRAFDRILLIKPSSLGDVVHALPVLHGLRARYPRARIDWLIAKPLAPLLEPLTELDELILFDRRRFARIGRNPRTTGEFVRFVRALRARQYDLAIDLQGLFRTGFLAWTTGARVRIGFRNAREGAPLFYTHGVRVENPDTHAVDRNYLVAQALGFGDVPIAFNLTMTGSVHAEATELLRAGGLDGKQSLVAVVPGARWETKVWPPERFAETVDVLQRRDPVQCVLLGSRDEAPLCERITAACKSTPINLAGRTDIQQFAAVLERADLVLCQDSAAVHLAVAFGRPLVCLVGPTNPLRTGPYLRISDVVQMKLDCAPCYLRRLSQCQHAHRCMQGLEVDRVLAAVERTLPCAASSPT